MVFLKNTSAFGGKAFNFFTVINNCLFKYKFSLSKFNTLKGRMGKLESEKGYYSLSIHVLFQDWIQWKRRSRNRMKSRSEGGR